MTVSAAPPLLEVPWLWNGLAYLNDRGNPDGHVALRRVTRTVDAPDTVEPNQGRAGSYAYPTSIKSATWLVEGVLRTTTLAKLRDLDAGLRSAFRDRQTQGAMGLLGVVPWFFYARVMDLSIVEEQTSGEEATWTFKRDVALTLRLLDPRIYVVAPAGVGNGTGARTLTNTGFTATDPTFTMPSFAGGDLVGRNLTLNTRLAFLDVPAGEVEVNFYTRTMTVDGVDRTALMDPSSTWWDENEQGLIVGGQQVQWPGTWSASWFNAADA